MRKILLIFCVVLIGSYLGCDKKTHIFKPEPVVGYYPLKVGNFWEYRDNSTLYEYHLRKEVVDFCLIQGGIGVYRVKYFSTYILSSDTVVQKNEWLTYQTFIDNEVREFSDLNNPDEYEILLRFPLEVGSSWQEPPRQMDSVWTFSIFIDSVVAVDNVTTPIGKFNDCYRIRSSMWGFEFPQVEKWFKPQLGFVKYRHALGMLEYSLIDYKIIK
ncbi:MAG: hypothetical protein WBD28_00260 [Candidatus Zixiibacteriota bacterium]